MRDSLHDQDFLLWAERQAELLRGGRLAELDIEGLLEAVADVGREQKVALQSMIRRIFVHLLRLALYPAREPRGQWNE